MREEKRVCAVETESYIPYNKENWVSGNFVNSKHYSKDFIIMALFFNYHFCFTEILLLLFEELL